MGVLTFPTKEQLDRMNDTLEDIAGRIGIIDKLDTWFDVQRIIRMGQAKSYFKVNDVCKTEFNGLERYLDVVGIDHFAPNSITFQFQDRKDTIQISAPQALYNAVTELSAGVYVFEQTSGGDKYEFETTQAVPEGGVIQVSSWSDPYVVNKVTTYEADRKTAIESGLTVTISSETPNLSPVNNYTRCRYGSNNYVESAARQILNSNEQVFKWEPQTLYDMPPTRGTIKDSGFLYLLDPDLVAVIGETELKVSDNNVTGSSSNQFTFTDKIFLLSRVEAGLGTEGTTTGEKAFEFYDGVSDAKRIKLDASGNPGHWWLRSPGVSTAQGVRYVRSSGVVGNDGAYGALSLAPAFTIL